MPYLVQAIYRSFQPGQTPRSICSPRRQSDLGGRAPIHMDFYAAAVDIDGVIRVIAVQHFKLSEGSEFGRSVMADIVDIAIPAKAQAAAEALGLVVSRSVTDGARVRRVTRDEAEIAIASCAIMASLLGSWRSTRRTTRLRRAAHHGPLSVPVNSSKWHEQKEGPGLVRQPAIGGIGFPALPER